MKKYIYKPKPLFWVIIFSLIISLFLGPIIFGLVVGIWFFIALVNFGNTINRDNRR
jgi:hypothetical protein